MQLIFRLMWVLLTCHLRPRLGTVLDRGELSLRVWLNDLDLNGHMNNSRYLSVMDLGRLALLNQLGVGVKTLMVNRWIPIVGGIDIRYIKSLAFAQRYELETSIVGWNEKWFLLEQRFVSEGQVFTHAYVKALLVDKSGSKSIVVPTQQLLHQLGYQLESPQLPLELQQWLAQRF